MRFPCFRAAAALVLASAAAGSQEPTVLFGVVTNLNGLRLAGVEMTIANTSLRAVTNDSGQFQFDTPPTGRLHLRARRVGFRQADHALKLDAGASRQEDFELEGVPEVLDSVRILGQQQGTGRMAAFWNRRMIGVGAFITRSEIEHRGAYRSSDLLRTINGVRVLGDNPSGRPIIQMGRMAVMAGTMRSTDPRKSNTDFASKCQVNYYVDGNWVNPETFHMDDLAPSSIEAVGIYRGPAEIPPAFRQRETACGLIVIWTREGPAKEKPGTTSLFAE